MANVSVLNTTNQLSGKTIAVCENDQTISGAWTFSGNQSFTGNVTLGNAVGDTLTITATITSNLLFTDATYDIGASGATRPRDLFLSRDAVFGGDLAINGGDLTSSATTFNLVNATVTTLNLGAAATTIQVGATTGTCTIRNATLSLTGGQIAFPGTQVASAGANTLDDYEEGTWTPVIGGSGGTSGQAYTTQTGTYVKVGQLVWASYIVHISTEGTITGDAQIQGLPFTVSSTMPAADMQAANPVRWRDLATSWAAVFAGPTPNTTVADLDGTTTAAVSAITALTASDIQNGTRLCGTIVYRADA